MRSVSDIANREAYLHARFAGIDKADAKEIARRVSAAARLAALQDEPLAALVRDAIHRRGQFIAEAARLRRERDALLGALAAAWHVSESEAWRIVRLDLEDDRDA
jgi:hypothetical protein